MESIVKFNDFLTEKVNTDPKIDIKYEIGRAHV